MVKHSLPPLEPFQPVTPAPQRDARLDVFRGLALAMIFINHVPGTIWETWTSRNFGFSDAAEGFVLMSGMAAGLAYVSGFRPHPTWAGARRIWRRAFTLYQVHLVVTLAAIAISAAAALWFDAPRLIHSNQVRVLFEQPLQFLVGVPLLTHQLGYANILPMYMVLLLATPLLLPLALHRPLLLLAGSVLLWAAAGQFRLNLPNYPNPGGWFFNPLSWQLLFVIGLLTGVALKQGRRFVPVDWRAQAAAAAMLLLALVVVKWPAFSAVFGRGLWHLNQAGLPFYITAFDKTFLSAPRLLHILALAYLLSTLPQVRVLAGSVAARPLALLGRHGLLVFAAGTVLCFAAQALRDVTAAAGIVGFAFDTGVIAAGLGLQLLLAALAERWRPRKPARARRAAELVAA